MGGEVFINERVSEGGVKAISAGAEIASNISARLRTLIGLSNVSNKEGN